MQFLSSQTPPLLAVFKDTYPFRDQPVKINEVSAVSEAQNFLELLEWLQNQGDPIAFNCVRHTPAAKPIAGCAGEIRALVNRAR